MHPVDSHLDVRELDLDPFNPRLPEEHQGSSQHKILIYLYDNDVLEELMDSYLSNGYFVVEPLLVLPEENGRRTVVEGNRRLAALMILLQLSPAVEAGISPTRDPEPTAEALDALRRVPGVEVESRQELADYLGFRHISGLKVWAPEAKARWLYQQVELAKTAGIADPFYEVGRRVGSNARGVRSSYNAYNTLRYGRDILKREADVEYVMNRRFGVWQRLLGTANVPSYLGLDKNVVTYEQSRDQVEQIDAERFAEVIGDLVPRGPRDKAVLEDSRDATVYSTILANDRARQTLRRYGNLQLATEVAEQGDIRNRLRTLIVSIEALTLDVGRYEITQADADTADELLRVARTFHGAVAANVIKDDQ